VPARPIDKFSDRHAYLQIADDMVRRIGEGEFTIKLPSERALAEEYECAYTTARRATEELRDWGVIVTIHGRGTFVVPAERNGGSHGSQPGIDPDAGN
jgi:DNA-binding GntR family transcriptional regulator